MRTETGRFSLSPEELSLLRDLLEEAYRNLKEEIYHTEDHAFKAGLKEREAILQRLLARINA
jgi:hypothetical protein